MLPFGEHLFAWLLITLCYFTFCEEVFEIFTGIYFPFSQDVLFQHHTGWKPTSEQHIKLVLAYLLLPSITVYLSLMYSAVALPDSFLS